MAHPVDTGSDTSASAPHDTRREKKAREEFAAELRSTPDIKQDDTTNEVVKAYLAGVVSSADAVRKNAQIGYTVASAVAAAIVGAGALAHIQDRGRYVEAAALITLCLWVLTAYQWMRTVAMQPAYFRPEIRESFENLNVKQFARHALAGIKIERQKVACRSGLAQNLTGVSMGATVVAIGIALWAPAHDDPGVHAIFTLSSVGSKQVKTVCQDPLTPTTVKGSADPAELQREYVLVTLDTGVCGEAKRKLRLRKRGILAMLQDG